MKVNYTEQIYLPLRRLLNVVPGAGVIAKVNDPSKPIQHVANRNVKRLTKYPVSLPLSHPWMITRN
jgi:hypothetical protein